VALAPGILARGPWPAGAVTATWAEAPYAAADDTHARADAELAALGERGSPTHDGLAARLSGFSAAADGLHLELEPVRWSLRLVEAPEAQSLSALCVVRDAEGRWLAGRRAAWLASWAGVWALGAGGSVELAENPAETLTRELEEEWSVVPEALSVEALAKRPSGLVLLVGMAWLAPGAEAVPDAEHDEFAWWPADIDAWPAEAHEQLRLMARLLV